MSGQSQKLPKWAFRATSAFPPLVTVERTSLVVRLVPCVDGSVLARAFFTFCSSCGRWEGHSRDRILSGRHWANRLHTVGRCITNAVLERAIKRSEGREIG